MKALTITAQPKAEAGWVHRFRNFGEAVYVRLRASCEVDIAEIDAAFDEFHVTRIQEEKVADVARVVADLNRQHHLDDSVFIAVCDAPVRRQTAGIVLDAGIGEQVWEIAGRYPIRIIESVVNRSAVESVEASDPARTLVTLWSDELEPLTENDWLKTLHGAFGNDASINKLIVYGAAVTPPVVAALKERGLEAVLPTASGFIALSEWRDITELLYAGGTRE